MASQARACGVRLRQSYARKAAQTPLKVIRYAKVRQIKRKRWAARRPKTYLGRVVRMVQDHRVEYPLLWAAVESIAPKIGCVAQTLLEWVTRVEIDSGRCEGLSTAEGVRQPRWRRAFDTVYHGSADHEKAA